MNDLRKEVEEEDANSQAAKNPNFSHGYGGKCVSK
jgi:hypothetical protein